MIGADKAIFEVRRSWLVRLACPRFVQCWLAILDSLAQSCSRYNRIGLPSLREFPASRCVAIQWSLLRTPTCFANVSDICGAFVAHGARLCAGQLRGGSLPSLWSDNRQRWGGILPTLWRYLVIRSGSRLSAAQQHNGQSCVPPKTSYTTKRH